MERKKLIKRLKKVIKNHPDPEEDSRCIVLSLGHTRLFLELLEKEEERNGWIEYDGVILVYEYRAAKKGEECLGTKNPKEYCNGIYSYSPKDPGNGMAYVVIGRIYRQTT